MLNKLAFILICATPILATLLYGAVHQPVIAAFYASVALLVFLLAFDGWRTGNVRVSRSYLQLPLWLLGTYALIQIIPFGGAGTISLDPHSTKLTAIHIFAVALFFSAALVIFDSFARLRKVANVVTIFGFIYAFYAILQSVLSPDAIYGVYKPQSVPFGSFVNRHDFASIVEMTIAVPLGMIFTGSVTRDRRLIYGVAVALMGTSLLLSGSRGGLVALVAEVILLVMLTSRAKGTKSLVLKLGLSAALILSAVGGAIFVGGDTSLTRFGDAVGSENFSSSRTHIWGVTVRVIGQNMPLGAGLGAFTQAYAGVDTSSGALRVDQAHNDYLQMLADAGVVGLLIGGAFLFLFFREGIRNAEAKNIPRRGIAVGAFAGCFAVLVHSLFDFVLHITAVSLMFLLLLALLVTAGSEYEDDERDELPRRRKANVTPIGTRA